MVYKTFAYNMLFSASLIGELISLCKIKFFFSKFHTRCDGPTPLFFYFNTSMIHVLLIVGQNFNSFPQQQSWNLEQVAQVAVWKLFLSLVNF